MIRRIFLLVCLLAFAACELDATGADIDSVSYTLQIVNGANLPTNYTFRRVGITVQAVSGSLQMDSNNTFAFRLTYSETVAGQTQTTNGGISGTWKRSGDTFTLTFPDGVSTTAAADGDRITWTFDGNTHVFVK